MQNYRKKIVGTFITAISVITIFYFLNYNFDIVLQIFKSLTQSYQEKSGVSKDWLKKYQLELRNEKDAQSDIDNDGLSLLAEFEYSTNPLNPDSDSDGVNDGNEVKSNQNPNGKGKLDIDNDGLHDDWEMKNNLNTKLNDRNNDNDGDNLNNYQEYLHGTNPQKFDTDGDSFSDLTEIQHGYDPAAPGNTRASYTMIIKKLNIEVPIIWSASDVEEEMQEDLKNGVVIYPKTGVPGQSGNTVIAGHSSNYAWAKGNYNYIFKNLNNLEIGDTIVIRVTQHNGKVFNYQHRINFKEVVKPDSIKIFRHTKQPSITLTTCWPLMTDWNRLIIKAEFKK